MFTCFFSKLFSKNDTERNLMLICIPIVGRLDDRSLVGLVGEDGGADDDDDADADEQGDQKVLVSSLAEERLLSTITHRRFGHSAADCYKMKNKTKQNHQIRNTFTHSHTGPVHTHAR